MKTSSKPKSSSPSSVVIPSPLLPLSASEKFMQRLHPHTQKIVQRVEKEVQWEQDQLKEQLRECREKLKELRGDLEKSRDLDKGAPAKAVAPYVKKINGLEKKIKALSLKVLNPNALVLSHVSRLREIQDDNAPIALLDGLSVVQAQEKIYKMLHQMMKDTNKRESVVKWGQDISDTVRSEIAKTPFPISSTLWFQNLYELDRFVRGVYAVQKILKTSAKRASQIQSSPSFVPSDMFPMFKERQTMAQDCFKLGLCQLDNSLEYVGNLSVWSQCIEDATALYDLGLALWWGHPKKIDMVVNFLDLEIADSLPTETFDFINEDDVREEYDKMCKQIIRSQKEKHHLLKVVQKGSLGSTSDFSTPPRDVRKL